MSSPPVSPRRDCRIRGALALLIALGPFPARADDAPSAATPDPKPPVTLAKVEVLGSKIRRVDVETAQPRIVLERADLERSGLTSLGDILQRLPISGQALNERVNNGGDGSVRLSLRNLGPNRTLVLVDGRRWNSGIDGAVDFTQIPLALVERVEVLADGASALYGSDAIAGVVNVSTRQRFDGAEFHAYRGEWQQGDGATDNVDAVWGHPFDRGSIALGASYVNQRPVFGADRDYTRVPLYGLPANDCGAGASPTVPDGRFIVPGLPAQIPGLPRLGLTLIAGRNGTTPDDFRLFDPRSDCYNFAPANYLRTPSERGAAYAQARYDVGTAVHGGLDLLYNRRRSAQLLAASPLAIAPGVPGLTGNTGISADNLYNPFGRTIRQFSRRLIESGGRQFVEDIDTLRFAARLDGEVDALARSWNWRLDASYLRSRGDTTLTGGVDLQAFANAVGPSFRDADGVARCGTVDSVIAGCVPANLFGGAGSLTDAMRDYFQVVSTDRSEDRLRDLTFDLSTELARLPHGPLAFATGLEYRRLSGERVPDPLSQQGLLGGGVGGHQITRGHTEVAESYAELEAPLAGGRPWLRELTVNAALRYSDYQGFGGTSNARLGMKWRPRDDLLLRANWAQGFRAPTLFELFQGTETGGGAELADPCQLPSTSPPASAATLARCAAAGVPAVFDPTPSTAVTSGGNPELRPETAVSRTLGFVYSPSWWPGFDLGIDRYRVVIDQAIGTLDAQTLVNRCYVLGEPRACARITRADDGHLNLVDATQQNLSAGFETEGYDLAAHWAFDTAIGRWRLSWDATYVDYLGDRGRPRRLTRLADGTVLQGNLVGRGEAADAVGFNLDAWRVRSVVGIEFHRGGWTTSLTGRFFSSVTEGCNGLVSFAAARNRPDIAALCTAHDRIVDLDGDGVGDPAATHRIPSAWFVDARIGWDAPWQGHVDLGIHNLSGRRPPIAYEAAAFSSSSSEDIGGRFLYVGYRQRF